MRIIVAKMRDHLLNIVIIIAGKSLDCRWLSSSGIYSQLNEAFSEGLD